jgi:hypothetical protein
MLKGSCEPLTCINEERCSDHYFSFVLEWRMPRGTLRSDVLGTYAPERFLIALPPQFGIVNPADMAINRMDEKGLSVLFHEYVHYLQNISTPAGFHAFYRTLELWRLFRETVRPDCTSAGSLNLARERQTWIEQYLTLGDALDGDVDFEWSDAGLQPDRIVIENCDAQEIERPLGAMWTTVTEVILSGRATSGSGNDEQFSYAFGTIAIMEGIAFELDQIVGAGENAAKAPQSAPIFPYHALRELAAWKVPGIETDVILRLACLSLLSNDPAGALIDLFESYTQFIGAGMSADEAVRRIYGEAQDVHRLIDAIVNTDIPRLERVFANAGALGRGVLRVLETYRGLLQRRRHDPFFELSVVDDRGHVDFESMRRLLADIPLCEVLQVNDGDDDQIGRDLLLSFVGGTHVARRDDELAVQRAAAHHVLSHLDCDRMLPTDQIGGCTCPFYECCILEMRKREPWRCKAAPWTAALWAGWPDGHTCWYGAAARASVP